MQKTFCEDCGKEILESQRVLCGPVKLGGRGELRIRVTFQDASFLDPGPDPDFCPNCALSVVSILKDFVVSFKDQPKSEVGKNPAV